jgi:hypothetical protein
MVEVLPFKSAQEALDAGFAEGIEDRQKGV